jgi:hypothetical protein
MFAIEKRKIEVDEYQFMCALLELSLEFHKQCPRQDAMTLETINKEFKTKFTYGDFCTMFNAMGVQIYNGRRKPVVFFLTIKEWVENHKAQ